ncbi:MAG: MmgE/PrpD family protein [Betaproteobacteria bacterium]|nr:MmgE/PrpD family protein [Betaproteobacteria bacterium]
MQGGHPTAVLLPAVLAVGEERRSTGREVLEAYVIGYEVLMKLARAVNFEHYYKGWHPTATLGVFGAAAAVARLLHLDAEHVRHALGIAASMASGVKANFGSYTKPFQVGHAAHKGVLSAVLAGDGLTASPVALEGKQGFAEVYNGAEKYDFSNAGFGDTFEIVEPGLRFKRYACCGSTHSSIDAALDLRQEQALSPEDIAKISVSIEKRRARHTDRPQYHGGYEGKFSLQYLLAAALTDGAISVAHFTDDSTARTDLRKLAERVTVIPVDRGESLSDFCELEVTFKDGTTRAVHRDSAEGRTAAEYPRCMREKFLDCVGQSCERNRAEALLESLLSFDSCVDVAGVMRQFGAPALQAATA